MHRRSPHLWLRSLEEAREFVQERGIVTLSMGSSLPSLFGACGPQREGKGFASWPEDKWWWYSALGREPGVLWTKFYRGMGAYIGENVAKAVDPLCRLELQRASKGDMGEEARRVVEHLARVGPALNDHVQEELGLERKVFRRARSRLERVGAILTRDVPIETRTGHRHTSELRRWDQAVRAETSEVAADRSFDRVILASIRAAVVAPAPEVQRWFYWPISEERLARLRGDHRVVVVEEEWLGWAEGLS